MLVAARAPRRSLVHDRRSMLWVAVALVAIAGLLLRIWIYRSNLGVPNSDESIVGLMTLHALHGDLSTFYWGSPYAGPQEVLLSVPLFAVGGANYLALRIVPIALSAVAAALVWRVGRRTIGEPAAAAAAGILWLWPPFDLFQNTQQQSFYAANLVYCALLVLLALRIVEAPTRLRVAWLGFVIGFGFWETPQIVPIAVPVVAWTIWKEPRALRQAWAAAVLAVVGALPWIVWNARHDWASLGVHGSLASYEHSLRLLASPVLPMTLGLRAPFSQTLVLPSALVVYAVYAALIGLLIVGAVRFRHAKASVLYVVAIVFPFIYAVDRRTADLSGWPQYTVVVTPVLALLVAQLATRWWRAALLVVLAGAVTAVSVPRMESWFREPQPVPRAPRDFAPLLAELGKLGLGHVYADYWIAYRVDFATQEHVVAVENQFTSATIAHGRVVLPPDPDVRYEPYQRTVAADPEHGFVFFRRTFRSVPIVAQLERAGYRRVPVGPFVIFAPRLPG